MVLLVVQMLSGTGSRLGAPSSGRISVQMDPKLQHLAICILSQAERCSGLEQLWRSCIYGASKKRNCLGVERVSDLIFSNTVYSLSGKSRRVSVYVVAKTTLFTEWEMEQEGGHE